MVYHRKPVIIQNTCLELLSGIHYWTGFDAALSSIGGLTEATVGITVTTIATWIWTPCQPVHG